MFGDEKIVFGLKQIGPIEDRDLEIVTMCDRIFRAGFNAETTKDTAAIINVIYLCEAFVPANALSVRTRIIFGFDIDAVGGTRSGA